MRTLFVFFNALNEARVAMRDGKWKVLAKLDGEYRELVSNSHVW